MPEANAVAEQLLGHLPVGLLVVDRHGIVVRANEQFATLAGVDRVALVGRPFSDLRWQERDGTGCLVPLGDGLLDPALDGTSLRNRRVELDTPTRGPIVLVVDADPVFDGDDGHWVVATFTDVTDTARPEQDGDHSSSRLIAAFENAIEGIVLLDDDGQYLAANPAAAALLGYSRDDLLRLHAEDVIVEGAYSRSLVEDFYEKGTATADVQLRRADGLLVDIAAHSVAHVEPGVHMSIWRDVTEQRRLDADLAASEERLDAIVEGVKDGLLLVDSDDVVSYANSAALELLGDTIVGGTFRLALADALDVDPDDHEQPDPTDEWASRETVVAARDGRRVRIVRTALSHAGGGSIVHLEDVTERERAERRIRDALDREMAANDELARVTSLKDTFLSAVSHELRTPLTAIQGFAATLQDHGDELDDDTYDMIVDRLRGNAERLQRLLDDLLDVDQLRRGAAELTVTEVSLRDVVTGAVEGIDRALHDVAIDVTDVAVLTDPQKLERILENLVSNAVRHTPPGTRIEVEAFIDGGAVVVRVDDSGPGIPADQRESVFEIFRKGVPGVTRSTGSGVGLALVREFVALLGGEVDLGRAAIGGASFLVRVPTPPAPRSGTSRTNAATGAS